MSTESQQEDGDSGFKRVIREAKEEAFNARRSLRREFPQPSIQTKIRVAAVLSDYRDVLYDYHDETALQTKWDDRSVDVDVLDRALSETTEISQPMNRRGSAENDVPVPLAAEFSARHLLQIGKELDAIAKELGFAASAKDVTPNTQTSEDDLAALLKARGQTQALENLPKRFRKNLDIDPEEAD